LLNQKLNKQNERIGYQKKEKRKKRGAAHLISPNAQITREYMKPLLPMHLLA